MTSIAGSSNVLIPEARAKISMRIVPGSEPKTELDALVRHLEAHVPWGAKIEVQRTKEAPGFRARPTDPVTRPRGRLSRRPTGSRSAMPAPAVPSRCFERSRGAAPRAEFILWGPEDVAAARIHASDESVDPSEIEKMVIAQALLIQFLAERG